jgi:hypothetical protein
MKELFTMKGRWQVGDAEKLSGMKFFTKWCPRPGRVTKAAVE